MAALLFDPVALRYPVVRISACALQEVLIGCQCTQLFALHLQQLLTQGCRCATAGPPPALDMQAPSLDWSLLDAPLPAKYMCKELVDPGRVKLVLGSKGLQQQKDEWYAARKEDRRQRMDPLAALIKYYQVAAAKNGTVEVQYTNTGTHPDGYRSHLDAGRCVAAALP
jgi:hypothetical protein